MNVLKEELEKIAAEYHLNNDLSDKFIEDLTQIYFCKWLEKRISSRDSILELGYGDGVTVGKLKNKAKSYTVIEGSSQLFEKMKILHPDIKAELSLFEDYRPKTKFDKILALHVLEHVDDPVDIVKHTKNWMHKNSELIVVVPNNNSIHRKLALEMGLISSLNELSSRDHLVGHQRVYDIASLKLDLIKAGFDVICEYGFFLKPLPNSMMLDYSEELLQAMNAISNYLPPDLMANICVIARIKN